ncbi:MAG TPA: RDD family protein [Burkholderiales bacterium]|nr:RDD family protein [Burkholderiales bacterium]
MPHFWVTHNGQRRGPYQEADILEAVELGSLRPTDLLWVDGMREGVAIADVLAHMGARGPRTRPPGTKVVDDLAELVLGNAEYAGFWVRLAAFLLDALILAAVVLVIGIGFLATRSSVGMEVVLALGLAASWFYFSFMESGPSGGTPGKRAFGLQVLSDRMARISFLRATVRWAARAISAAVLAIGYLMQPFTARKQALHDLVAHTVVLSRVPRPRVLSTVIVLCVVPLLLSALTGALLKLAELLRQ